MTWQVVLFVSTFIVGSMGSNFASCPLGWHFYSSTSSGSCLSLSSDYASYLRTANKRCKEINSSLVIIDTEEKLTMIKTTKPFSDSKIWIGLQIRDGKQVWQTKDGSIPANNVPFKVFWSELNDEYGIVLSNGNVARASYYDQYQVRSLCEKHADCLKGWFGHNCDRECHCYEEECDVSALELKCTYGCQVGWMGEDCSQKKEDAEVRYFCVNSHDQGKYAHVVIDTKGVQYDNINPINSKEEWVSWCNNTVIYDKGNHTTHIKIYVNDETDEDINDEICAGLITNTGSYEWKIKIQEHNGLVSKNDQEMSIECDFAVGDKFILSSETKIQHESMFKNANIKRPTMFLGEKKEGVKLEIIDPAKNVSLNETILGSPVVIRISFGFKKDNIATGVRPYNCKASSPNGKKTAMFLDKYGCSINDSPISEFHKAGTKTIMTNPFPLFGFDGAEEIEFHCSYSPCFKNEDCKAGCDVNQEHGRIRRSIDEGNLIKNKVKLLHP